MKNINPIGRTPGTATASAFGCICNDTVMKDQTAVSGNVPCNVCAYSCEPGNSDNLKQNLGTSTDRMKHTG